MFKTLTLPPVLRFGAIEVCAAERRVVDGVPAPLGARSLDLLLVLLEYRERTMAKNELLDLVWPGLVGRRERAGAVDRRLVARKAAREREAGAPLDVEAAFAQACGRTM